MSGLTANAASISFGFNGNGIWPREATKNSQRWFRVHVTWDTSGDPDRERIDGIYLESGASFNTTPAAPSGLSYSGELNGGAGMFDTPENGTDSRTHFGLTRHGSWGSYVYTVGPFSAYHYRWLVGRVYQTSTGGTS
ncbi:MAG: hypothetical protein U9R79_12390, partial [Armatimonadota bacterium]|nr:hypothetical protein [Armatimonadota bacterium]